MLLSAVSVSVVAQSISEIPEGLMNNPVYTAFSVTAVCQGAEVSTVLYVAHLEMFP